MKKLKLIILDLYGQDLQWIDQIFDESNVEYCEIFDLKGESNPYIGNINDYSGWDYLIIPVLKEHESKIKHIMEQLCVSEERIVYISSGNLSSPSLDSIMPFFTNNYREHIQYEKGLSDLITVANDSRHFIWTLISLDQESLRILYGKFGVVPDTLAFFLNNSPEGRIYSIYKLLDYLALNITNGNYPCFIIYARVLDTYPFIETILKSYYPGCKLILYYGDLVQTHSISPNTAQSRGYDVICTFDKKESETYNIPFVQEPLSAVPQKYSESSMPEKYDVLFIGQAKNRLTQILEMYDYLTMKGLSCEFYIFRVKEKDMKYPDKINYNKWLDYEDILKLDSQSKCLLEIMQNDVCFSPTTRHSESKILRKKLLTNCPELETSNQKNIIYFNDLSSIDIDSITKPYEEDPIDYHELLSVEHMIDSLKILVLDHAITW